VHVSVYATRERHTHTHIYTPHLNGDIHAHELTPKFIPGGNFLDIKVTIYGKNSAVYLNE